MKKNSRSRGRARPAGTLKFESRAMVITAPGSVKRSTRAVAGASGLQPDGRSDGRGLTTAGAIVRPEGRTPMTDDVSAPRTTDAKNDRPNEPLAHAPGSF